MTGEDARRIITFYSYKGGTGRTMALANTAWILSSTGHRVLVVDWDLDAPGLDRFLHPFLSDSQLRATPGVLELVSRSTQFARSMQSRGETFPQIELGSDYASASDLHDHVSAAGRPVFSAMFRIYSSLLNEIEKRNYDVFTHRIRVSSTRKLAIAWTSLFGRRSGSMPLRASATEVN